ncbi:MAG: hypothetical protein R2911_35700 [Caldilineaceae bacterium]
MLRRPDAALLPNGMPGRGYLQIGNENIELIQVSWTGENQPDEARRSGALAGAPEIVAAGSDRTPAFFDAAVALAYRTRQQMAPKPGFLPTHFSLQSSLVDAMQNRTLRWPQVSDWLNGDTAARCGPVWIGATRRCVRWSASSTTRWKRARRPCRLT